MRHLASIQRISSISPIDGADRIELAHILGWQCVAKKNEFKEGDLAVYFEIDSFLPIKPEFEFLRSSSYKNNPLLGEGFRLKTIQLKGHLSQGLLLPLSILPDNIRDTAKEGDDVTEILGIRKYEIPEMATGNGVCIGDLPHFIFKTDETRIQSKPGLLDEFKGIPYYISTKMDGSSFSLALDSNNNPRVCSHNYELKADESCLFYKYAKRYLNLMKSWKEKNHLDTLVLQGEFCGPKIQGNKIKLLNPEWFVFNIYEDGILGGYSNLLDSQSFIGHKIVPIEELGDDISTLYKDIPSLLNRSIGNYSNIDSPKEGIVIRPQTPIKSQLLNNHYLSMKVINNQFLVKCN